MDQIITNIKLKIEDFIAKHAITFIILFFIIVTLSLLTTCNSSKKVDSLRKELSETYSVSKKDSMTIVTQKQLLVTKDDALAKAIAKSEQLKDLKSQVIYKTSTVIKNVYVPYIDTTKKFFVYLHDTVNGKDFPRVCLPLPAALEEENKNLYFRAHIDTIGLSIDSLSIPDSVSITIGDTKDLFKKQSVVRVVHSNPYILTNSMQNVVVDDKSVKKQVKAAGLGFLTGFCTGAVLSSISTFYFRR